VTFDARVVQLDFDSSALDVPLPKADVTTSAVLEAHAVRAQSAKSIAGVLTSQYGLTRRDAVLTLRVCSGMRNREIAQAMGYTEGTVKQYLSRVFEMLDVRNRTELVAFVQGGAVASPDSDPLRVRPLNEESGPRLAPR
jgi:DNA-binding CsgD family transcriptional regulator